MEKWFLHLREDPDKGIHIFGQIMIFPVAYVEAAPVFDPLDGVDTAIGIELRRHLDVVDRADEHGITGQGSAFAHLDAGGLQENPWLNIIHDKQPVLSGADTVAGFAADKEFLFGFCDTDLRARGDSFCQRRAFAGEENQFLILDQDIVKLFVFRVGGQAGQIQGALQDHGLDGGRAVFVQIQIDQRKLLPKSGQDIGEHLHGPLNRDPQSYIAVVLVVDLLDLPGQVLVDRQDLSGCLRVFLPREGQGDGIRIPVEDRGAEVGLSQLDHLAERWLGYIEFPGRSSDAAFL